MLPSPSPDPDGSIPDPIKQFIPLLLSMAHLDRATALRLGKREPGGRHTAIRYEVDGVWHDGPSFPEPMAKVAMELERLAGLSDGTPEGIREQTVAGATMRWKVKATAPGTEYILTPIPD